MDGATSADWPARLDRILRDLRDNCALLAAFAERQSDLVQRNAMDDLLSLLRDRQRVVDQITSAAERLAPFVRDWANLRAQLPEDRRQAVEAELAEIDRLTRGVAERDAADRAALEKARDETAVELAGIGRGQRALQAYGGGARGPKFQDRKG